MDGLRRASRARGRKTAAGSRLEVATGSDAWCVRRALPPECSQLETLLTYNRMVVDALSEREADRVFHALADSTRRDILARAIEREQSVSALARHYEISFAAVQKHVAVLERAALISQAAERERADRPANPRPLRRATALLDAFEQLWIQRAEQDRRRARRRGRRNT